MSTTSQLHPLMASKWSIMTIRRASAQGVSDHQKCAFDIGPFHFFKYVWNICNRSQLKQPFSSSFSKPEPWTRTRATIRARAIVSCLSYAHARRRLREPPDTPVVVRFQVGGAICLKRVSERFVFFWKNMPNGAPDGLKHVTKSYKKTHLKRSIQNMLKMY